MSKNELDKVLKKKFILCDCETGGTDSRFSLLSAHFSHLSDNMEIVSSLDLKFRPDNGIFVIMPEAMGINKIDLADHENNGVSYYEGYQNFSKFVQEDPRRKDMQCNYHEDYEDVYTLVGWNIGYDIEFLKRHLFDNCVTQYEDSFSYTSFDVKSIAINLQNLGLLPEDLKLSLGNLANHFNIDASKAHNAREDCILTLKVLEKLNQLILTQRK